MDTSKTIVSFLLGVGVLLAIGSLHTDIGSSYIITNRSTSGNFSQFNSSFADMTGIAADIQNNTGEFAKKVWYNPEKYYDAVVVFGQIGNFIAQIPNVLGKYISFGISSIGFKLPEWFTVMVLGILTVVFALTVASYVLKRSDM